MINPTLLRTIASLLELGANQSAVAELAERKDLEPVCAAALNCVFPGRAEKDRKVAIPEWDHVGRVDLILRDEPGSEGVIALVELKWCRADHDILYEAIWDMFKLALGTRRAERPRAFLLSGAPQSVWETSGFSDLFDNGSHDPVELCSRELNNKEGTLAWDAALDGGYDHYPVGVPESIRTEIRGRVGVGDWDLRAVEVFAGSDELLGTEGGWPRGVRPVQAVHPLPAPAERFIDTDADVQFDQATDPKNVEMMRQIRHQLREADGP